MLGVTGFSLAGGAGARGLGVGGGRPAIAAGSAPTVMVAVVVLRAGACAAGQAHNSRSRRLCREAVAHVRC